MISVDIPGFGSLRLAHLVLDYNGTLAVDGALLPGVAELLLALAPKLRIHVVTADTFGVARAALARLPVEVTILRAGDQAEAKLRFVTVLDAQSVAAVGNGRNDQRMLAGSALGIAVVQAEGAAHETLAGADIVIGNVVGALELLRHPQRLVATLRA